MGPREGVSRCWGQGAISLFVLEDRNVSNVVRGLSKSNEHRDTSIPSSIVLSLDSVVPQEAQQGFKALGISVVFSILQSYITRTLMRRLD
jgi:hypothetical protein